MDESRSAGRTVREVLERLGVARHVVEGGLPYLLRRWTQTVESIEHGYGLTFDDYLNDMDSRQILHDLFAQLPEGQHESNRRRLDVLDQRVRELLIPAKSCLWGEEAARRHGWRAEVHWWYFTVPRTNPDFYR